MDNNMYGGIHTCISHVHVYSTPIKGRVGERERTESERECVYIVHSLAW